MKLFSRLSSHKSHSSPKPNVPSPTKHPTSSATRTTHPQPSKHKEPARQSFEMVKRRVRIPVAIFDKPLMSEIEFVVDPRYHNLKLLGSGSFGVVVSAIDKQSGQRVAIKRISGCFSTTRTARYVLREVRLLHHLRHPHIVSLLDIDVPRQYRAWDDLYIVSPLLRTDLTTAMREGLLSDARLQKRVAFQILSALEHMHAAGLMHRDVKARNVLLDDALNVQLCDLGHSRYHSRANSALDAEEEDAAADEPELTSAITTMVASAPELALGGEYDASVDVWAAATVIAEVVNPRHATLFDSTARHGHLQEVLDVIGHPTDEELAALPAHGRWYARRLRRGGESDIRDTLRARIGEAADPLIVDLLARLLCFSPEGRLTAEQAMRHEWFDNVREVAAVPKEPYNFAESEPGRKATKGDLKQLVWQEVMAFHPEATMVGGRR